VVSKWTMRFAIPNEWLTNRSSGPEKVHLFRLEKSNWSEYPVKHEMSVQGLEFFTVDVPGFSFFVITADGVEPVIIPPSQSNTTGDTSGSTGNTSTNPGSGTDGSNTDDTGNSPGAGSGDIAEYSGGGLSLWWFIVPILAILSLGFGGAYFMKTREERQKKMMEVEALDSNDPLYHLQEYIMRALMHGHSPDEIKHKLMGAGWDDIIIEEEIEKSLTRRVG
ncbi:PGF-pre-PGF domain-containing protein, partial [Candidatus Woesearchaeota archaeon]|nr:PGF-pre-PGF domain-containing protein [Candidatus Woesearchaeota archaeon]